MNERLFQLAKSGDKSALEALITQERRKITKRVRDFQDIEGLIFYEIDNSDNLHFKCIDGREFVMLHHQDCCESVTIEDINGDLENLLWTPIISAKEESKEEEDNYGDRLKWTFYHLRTAKGDVTIRWIGSDNGYYSVSVSFEEKKNERY
jgi:hypothetical protein